MGGVAAVTFAWGRAMVGPQTATAAHVMQAIIFFIERAIMLEQLLNPRL
jgi:hypothetical protein